MRALSFVLAVACAASFAACGGSTSSTSSSSASSSAASSGQSSSSASSSSGQGGAGGACNHCFDVIKKGLPTTSLCNGAPGKDYEQLQSCMCDSGPCGAACQATACTHAPADKTCLDCLAATCASTLAACKAD